MRVIWTKRALRDLRRIADRIALDKPRAAQSFAAMVLDKVNTLARFPFIGRHGALPDTRELVLHRNDLVTYRVRAEEVQILQVWHVARQR